MYEILVNRFGIGFFEVTIDYYYTYIVIAVELKNEDKHFFNRSNYLKDYCPEKNIQIEELNNLQTSNRLCYK